MKPFMLVTFLFLSGCGLLSSGYGSALAQVIEKVAEVAFDKAGKELSELPMVCEHEYHPDTGQILVLCTVETKK
jgi:hypothetical protein